MLLFQFGAGLYLATFRVCTLHKLLHVNAAHRSQRYRLEPHARFTCNERHLFEGEAGEGGAPRVSRIEAARATFRPPWQPTKSDPRSRTANMSI